MVKALASGQLDLNGQSVQRIHAPDFPRWLQEEYPELEDDFPRIAVSPGRCAQESDFASGQSASYCRRCTGETGAIGLLQPVKEGRGWDSGLGA